MALDAAGIKIELDAREATANAQAFGKAAQQMGTDVENAATKAQTAGQKMGAGIKSGAEAAQAAATSIQAALSRITSAIAGAGGGRMDAFAGAFAQAQRSIAQLTVMQTDAATTAKTLGGTMGAAYTEVSAKALQAAEAMRAIVAEMTATAKGGTVSAEALSALQTKVQAVGASFEGLGTMQRAAFESVAASSEAVVAKTFDLAKAEQEAAAAFARTETTAKTASTAESAAVNNVTAAHAKKQVAIKKQADDVQAASTKEKTATQQVAGAVDQLGRSMQATSGHASRMGQNIMLAERGAHDVLTTFGLASGSANMVGRLVRGFDDMFLAMARGGAGMLSFSVGMIGFSLAMKGVNDAMTALSTGFKAASAEEGLGVKFTNLLGSSKAAGSQLDQIKQFVTGGAGGFLKFDDVAEGVKNFESLNNVASITNEQLKIIAGAAAMSGESFTKAADQYGKITNAIKLQLPIRAQLLVTMQQEGIINAATVSKVESLAKAHAGAAAEQKALDEGMRSNINTAEQMTNTFDGLMNQINQTFTENIAEPFGAAIETALKPVLKAIKDLFSGHETEIKAMADKVEHDLLFAINYVKDYGIVQSWQDGIDTIRNYIRDHIVEALTWAGQTAFKNWETFIANIAVFLKDQFLNNLRTIGIEIDSLIKKTLPEAGPDQALVESLQTGYGRGMPGTPTPQAYSATWAASAKSREDVANQDKARAAKDAQTADKGAANANKIDRAADKFLQAPDAMIAAIQTGIQAALSGMGAQLYGGPMPAGAMGGLRATAYGFPGDLTPDKWSKAGIGAFTQKLQAGAVAMNPETAKAFGLQPMQQAIAEFTDATGQVTKQLVYWADTGPKPGVIDRYLPGIAAAVGNAYQAAVKLAPLPAFGPPGAQITPPSIAPRVPETPEQLAAMERHRRETRVEAETRAQMLPSVTVTAPKVGGPAAPVPGKAAKDLSEQKKLTDDLANAEKNYDAQIKRTEEDRRAHLISNQAAYQKELEIYKQETTELETIRGKFAAVEAAAVKANDTAKAEAYHQKLEAIDRKLADIAEKMKLIGAQTFGGQFGEQLQKNIDSMQFTGTKAADLLTRSLNSVGDAFISIIDGSQKASDAFKKMAQSIIDDILKMVMQMLESQLLQWIQSLASAAGGGVGGGTMGIFQASIGAMTSVPTGQGGGFVFGASGTDRVPAMLTAGEFVVRKEAADKLGASTLAAINVADRYNAGGFVHSPVYHFQGGGLVAGVNAQNIAPSQKSGGGGGPITLATTINLGGTGATQNQQGAGQGMNADDVKKFHEAIQGAIKEEISRQKRPGGSLNPNSR